MQFTYIDPKGSQSLDINWLEVQTNQGNFVVQKGHVPMIVVLTPNQEITMQLVDGSTTVMAITGGILEIKRNEVILLIT